MSLVRLGRQRVGRLIIAVNTLFLVCLIASSAILLNGLNQLKVHGPIYVQIKNAVDLTADILPPPLYLIEAYLTVQQLNDAQTAEEKKGLLDRLSQLEKDFDTRQDYWKDIDLPEDVRTILIKELTPPARKMIRAIHDEFLPALSEGRREDANKALTKVTALYKEHRTGVDHLVTAATDTLTHAEEFSTEAEHTYLLWAYIALALTVLLAILGAVILTLTVARPLRTVTATLGRLADGNTDVDVGDTIGAGEMPSLWRAVTGLREKVLAEKKLLAEQDVMKQKNEEEKKTAMHDLATSFQSQIGSIIDSVGAAASQLQSTAQEMKGTAEDTTGQTNMVATASGETALNVQTVSSATEELSASVREIQQRMNQSNSIIQQAAREAEQTNERVSGLTQAANKIGTVVQLITEIAAQTNLLALNATIEAARAGEAGKGFAVVASEVKNLAGQTAKATEEIAMQIKNIQDETKASAEAITHIVHTIEEVSETSGAIAAAVEEQGAATQEISRNVAQAARGTQEVSSSVLEVSKAAQRTGSAATQVLAAAQDLSHNGGVLKQQVHLFLSKIRAA